MDWVLGTVMHGGCNMLEFSDSVGREKVSQAVVLLLGGGEESISGTLRPGSRMHMEMS